MTSADADREGRLIWILGSPRSGSTWLMSLLGSGGGVRMINEPAIGAHLGTMLHAFVPLMPTGDPSVYRLDQFRRDTPDYFFSEDTADVWKPGLRQLILDRLEAQRDDNDYIVLKEPHGSQAAEMLMSVLPGSRMIFLLRDGRDVVDSILDAVAQGGWLINLLDGFDATDRETALTMQSYLWAWRTEAVARAYERHPDHLRRMVRYEDLRADPESVLRPLAEWLGLDAEQMLQQAGATAAERLPTGAGKFIRAASPGLWRQSFSDAERAQVERIMGAQLKRYGYEID